MINLHNILPVSYTHLDVYKRQLMCCSQWDGAYEPIVEMKTPVYFVIGESDEYYGSEPFKEAYQQIHEPVSYTHLDVYKRQERILSVNRTVFCLS